MELSKSVKERFGAQITWENNDLVSGNYCGLLADIDIIFHWIVCVRNYWVRYDCSLYCLSA